MATPKAVIELRARMDAMEAEMAQLKLQISQKNGTEKNWLDELYGAFAGDQAFLEAMQLGREYRESLLTALEAEVTQLKQKVETIVPEPKPWWRATAGSFADDPIYEEAMRLGREYRESLRPKASKKSNSVAKKNVAKQGAWRKGK
jgi:hypothetical protein